MVKLEKVIRRYSLIKENAISEYKNGNYDKSLRFIRYASLYGYEYNFQFFDLEIERLGKSIAELSNTYTNESRDVILFYQYMPRDVRGLAYIYLKALVDSHREFIWISYKSYETSSQRRLMSLLESSDNGRIIIIDDCCGSLQVVKEWQAILKKEKPKTALLIPAPWDVECLATFATRENIDRILVNGTDHTFWYGVNTFDKVLEFRDWGYNISKDYRNISEAKLFKLPYYPRPTEKQFAGFPFQLKDSQKLLVSGGGFYKIYGSEIFLDTIKYILKKHIDCIFYFMGSGDDGPLMKFIRENRLEDRFFVSNEREDFDEVIKRAYLYINTYPLIGALMVQYAVANRVVPVGLNSLKDACNDVSGLFLNHSVENCNSERQLRDELDRLIDDDDYYKNRKKSLDGALLNEDQFRNSLFDIIDGNSVLFEVNQTDINLEELQKPYLDRASKIKSYIRFCKNIIKIKLGLL